MILSFLKKIDVCQCQEKIVKKNCVYFSLESLKMDIFTN